MTNHINYKAINPRPDMTPAEISQEIKTRIADLNELVQGATEHDMIIDYDIRSESYDNNPHIIVTVSQRV